MSRLANKMSRASLAVLLSLWITGAGCMFGCQTMIASAANGQTDSSAEFDLATIVSGETCASTGAHDCCAKKNPEAQRPKSATARLSLKLSTLLSQSESLNSLPSGGMRECPLAMSRAVATSKSSDRKELVAVIALPAQVATVAASSKFQAAIAPAARLPNRGHTYLRCCAFLI
jgi:hypothetical protein